MGLKIRSETTGFRRRHLLVLMGAALLILAVTVGLIVVFAGGGRGKETVGEATSLPATSTPTPSPLPSPTWPPTDTFTPAPTATLEPYQYIVQPGDTLYYIIQLFGYRDLAVVPEVIALNGMADENDLQANQVLLIPRQTPTLGPTLTPTPLGATGTPSETVVASGATPDYHGCGLDNRCISADGQFWMHEVREGETPAGLAYAYDTTVRDIFQDNGLTENSFIFPGQILRIRIKVTLTPTLTPTGGPDSTATPTPTLSPPALLAPANGAKFAGNQQVVLQWAANQPLASTAYYLVQVRNIKTGEIFRATTRSNIYRLPADLRPGVGQSVDFAWRVVIVGGSTVDAVVISGQEDDWVFTWGP